MDRSKALNILIHHLDIAFKTSQVIVQLKKATAQFNTKTFHLTFGGEKEVMM